jgi:hypothetical protein
LRGPPVPIDGLLGEIEEWTSDFGVVWNEVAIITGEAQELANLSRVPWGFPLSYTIQFAGVHSHLVPSDNHAQVFDFFFGKFAFGGFEIEIIIMQLL